MQRKKSVKKWNCEHYAANSLFYQTPLVLWKNGQIYLSIFKIFYDFIFFLFSLKKLL